MAMGIRVKKQDALDYHSKGRPGKLEIIPSKPCLTQRDLSIAYTPYVAEPCREIEANPDDVYKYTGKGNLVGVISNGTAVRQLPETLGQCFSLYHFFTSLSSLFLRAWSASVYIPGLAELAPASK